jgi:A/G-specific adenine glycosylase
MSRQINTILIDWYLQKKRELPWRNTRNPYFIWLSEIILQQTRVQQGTPYYERFISRFPTVFDLANAEEQEVLNYWQGLGYYSRARNLHKTAKIIANDKNGFFPENYKEILSLPGIGPYTAAAIASFSYNLPYAVLDGNVFRVLSRLYNEPTPIDSTQGKKTFNLLADELLNINDPATHNQAMMEFGAMQCTPRNPNCEDCPLMNNCLAFENNTVSNLPLKEKKTKVRNRFLHYFIVHQKDKVALYKREKKDIWQHLYEPPLAETEINTEMTQLINHSSFPENIEGSSIKLIHTQQHLLSHQKLHISFYQAEQKELKTLNEGSLQWVKINELEDFPVPKPIHDFFEKHLDTSP